MSLKIFPQAAVIVGTTFFTAYAVDKKLQIIDFEAIKQRFCGQNHLCVHLGRIHAEDFHSELVMLSKPPRLRSFVTKYRCNIVAF